MKDIYFEKDYGRLYEEIEGGKCEVFNFQSELGQVQHLFLKRAIPTKLGDEAFYDLTTPYGYGGPVITEFVKGKKAQLTEAFHSAFRSYCKEQNVVSEFIRFHPVLKNADDFTSYCDVIYKRNTLQTNLADHDDPILNEFSSSCRRDIRHALKVGVEFKVTPSPEDLKGFKEIYHSTMKRNEAKPIYFFNDVYFSNCLKYFKNNLVLVEVIYEGRTIGMSLNFSYGDFLHVHLSGTLQEFHRFSPAYVLQYALALWGKENGKKLIHLGGGRTGEKDDKLFLFKKKFSRNKELEYFVGQKIWNPEIYKSLCKEALDTGDLLNFPAYR